MKLRRLRLRRSDGRIYLERWGIDAKPGGIFIHKMSAPDPGSDLHDHPYSFVSLIIKGGYTEKVADIRAVDLPRWERRFRWSMRLRRLDQAHSITSLHEQVSWSLVIHGPRRRAWGFYVLEPWGVGRWSWVEDTKYKGDRRHLVEEIGK